MPILAYDPSTGQWGPSATSATPALTIAAIVDNSGASIVDGLGQMTVESVVVTTRLTVTIDQDGTRDGGTRHAELVQAGEMLWRVTQQLISTGTTTGTVLDRNGVPTGHWTYFPTAPS